MYTKQQFFKDVKNQYETANQKAIAEGQKPPGMPIITSSSLRLEQFLNTSTSQYTFPVIVGETTPGTTIVQSNEVRLLQNDNFHIHKIGFYLAVTAASTDTAFRLQTNGNEIFLTSAAIALNYLNLWGGNININVNQVDILTNWRTSQHFMTGQTQRLASTVNTNFDQIDLSQDGLITCEPGIMLSGAYTNRVNLNLNSAVTSAIASNVTRVVIIFDGVRCQNAAIRK